MPAYYAVTRRNGQWSYICAGHDPEAVYRQAVAILTDAEAADGNITHSPDEERAMDNMRVIPEVTAKGLRITYPRTVVEE